MSHIAPRRGLWVDYALASYDVEAIAAQRDRAGRALVGNPANGGDVYPMLITRPWGDTPTSAVNGQVFLDGNDALWVTSRQQDENAAPGGQPPSPGRWGEAAR
jgi:hypothetical protein